MPLTFPTSPTNGQTTTLSGTTYTYNATKGVWEATASGGGFVAGSFSEHILPDTNDTYDIGSAEKKIRDLYVSDNSLHIGDHTMSADSEGINIPALKLGTGSNRVKLTANAQGKLRQVRTVGGVAHAEEGISSDAGTTAVDTMAELQATPVIAGKTVLVRNTNKLYINTGTGWYVVGQVTNESPTAITGLDATYSLASDGTATVITMNSTDPEGFPLTWSHAVTTGTLGSTATITNVDNVFTITPSTTEADAGSFSVTFSASDGNQAATSVSAFVLSFGDDPGRAAFYKTSPTYNNSWLSQHNWTVPTGVTSICVLCIGAGGGGGGQPHARGGGGGGLAWKNDIPVTAGDTYNLWVGTPGKYTGGDASGDSNPENATHTYMRNSSNTVILRANGGYTNSGGTHNQGGGYYVSSSAQFGTGTSGGGYGGQGGDNQDGKWGGGGGAAGYTGNGGRGGYGTGSYGDGLAGSGGGGGGAGSGSASVGAGGTGRYGQGSNGNGGAASAGWGNRGYGGSGGEAGQGSAGTGEGGNYGGGGSYTAQGGDATIQIIWGAGRSYPNTLTTLADDT